jgi:hypothetical protein
MHGRENVWGFQAQREFPDSSLIRYIYVTANSKFKHTQNFSTGRIPFARSDKHSIRTHNARCMLFSRFAFLDDSLSKHRQVSFDAEL